MSTRTLRIVAWTASGLLVLLSIGPPSLRPSTGLEHHAEHFLALFLLGWLFGKAYARHSFVVLLVGLGAAALVECAQMIAPGRHGNLNDFLWNGAGLILGVLTAMVWRRISIAARST